MGWIKNIYNFLKLRKELKKDYEKEQICEKFTELYGIEFKSDWAARIYAVVNPALQNIRDNGTSQIFEYDENGITDKTYIKNWIMTKLVASEKYIAAANLLDILLFDMKELQVDGQPSGNYLIVFTPFSFPDFVKSWKALAVTVFSVIAAAIVITPLILTL